MSVLGRALERGDVVQGVGATTFAPSVVETCGTVGMDFVWLDYEHKGPSPADGRALANLVRASECVGTELLVRLPGLDPWLVRKVLDTGVQNLLLPRVETAPDVREVIRATEFVYDDAPGERGVANCRDSDWGAGGYEPTNGTPGVGVMIETTEAIENLGEILSVPGLDFTYLGKHDLAVSLGHPFETDHPSVREEIESIREQCRAAGVPLGRSVSSTDAASTAVQEGWRVLRFRDELTALRGALTEFSAAMPDDATKD